MAMYSVYLLQVSSLTVRILKTQKTNIKNQEQNEKNV